ncbi:MAG: hypothetical protein ACK5O7_01845 [Holosporales bacterium]
MSQLFDHRAQENALSRALQRPVERFLHQEAATLLTERLKVVRHPPQKIVVLGDPFECMTPLIHEVFPHAPIARELTHGSELIVDFMALHTIEAVPERMRAAHHHLAPRGLYLSVFLGGDTLAELRHALLEAELGITGGAQARIHPMIPLATAMDLLRAAGLELPVADHHTLHARYTRLRNLARDLRDHAETCTLSSRSRTFSKRDIFHLAEAMLKKQNTDQTFEITFDFIFLSGWRATHGI